MRIFVTGASGWIGSALGSELIGAGHQVVALARSDASAEAVADLGAEVLRGDINDPAILRAGPSTATASSTWPSSTPLARWPGRSPMPRPSRRSSAASPVPASPL